MVRKIVPSNQTFLDGTLEIAPLWNVSTGNGSQFGVSAPNQWNGTHTLTNGIGHGGKLTLATNSSLGSITDFESSVVVAPGWMGTGRDHEVWSIQRPSIVPYSSQSGMLVPSNGSAKTRKSLREKFPFSARPGPFFFTSESAT